MARPSYLAAVAIAWLAAGCQITTDVGGAQFACDQDCPDGLACIEGRCVDPAASDAGAGDDAAPDAPACECSAERFADDCGANLVDIESGMKICASTESNTNAVLGCPGAQVGPDAAFRLAAEAGQTITATVRPEGFNASLYITRDCSGTCEAIADDAGISGTETVSAPAPVTGDYFVVVDSPTGSGCYELEVTVD